MADRNDNTIPESISVVDGINVNEIAAELANLEGVCHAAADSANTGHQAQALYAVAFSLGTLTAKLSAIGARLERG